MGDTPRLGTVLGAVENQQNWHIGEEQNFCIQSLCDKRFAPLDLGWKYNDWVAQHLLETGSKNLCQKCRRSWEHRNERVTELNSLFNLPDERLAPAGPNVSFSDWLTESDRQEGHLDEIQYTI